MIADSTRMLLREMTLEDVKELATIFSDPEVMRYSSKGPLTEEDTKQFVQWCSESYREHGFGQWAVVEKESSAVIGCCGLSYTTVDGQKEVEVGYRFARRYWGQGLASEASALALAHGFRQHKLPSVVAIIAPEHKASVRVAEKSGFRSFVCTEYSGWQVRVYRQLRSEQSAKLLDTSVAKVRQ